MNHYIDIQHACSQAIPVSDEILNTWVQYLLSQEKHNTELTLRFVEKQEITALNHTYRKQDKATNVLAFPSELPEAIMIEHPFLGDVIICPAVLEEESHSLQKPLVAHWAHIVLHGVLHLLGYDHIEEKDAIHMHAREIEALAHFGFDNPYLTEEDHSID